MDRTAQGLKDLPKVICVGILSYGRHTRCGQRLKYFTASLQVRLWLLCNSWKRDSRLKRQQHLIAVLSPVY